MSSQADRRQSGAIAVALLALLSLASALMTAALLRLDRWSDDASALMRTGQERAALDEALGEVIERIAEDPTPRSDAPTDPVWQWVHSSAGADQAVLLFDVSSRINPNWIRRGVFEKTGLRALFTPDATVGLEPAQAFLQYRQDNGFTVDIEEGYGSFFSKETIRQYLSPWSYANLNTSDEFALRALYEGRIGDATGAEIFHTRIRELLADRRIVEEPELHAFLEDDYAKLFPLVNALPWWNIHFLPALILEQILAYPDYHVADSAAKAARILERRETQEIGPEGLRRIVGLPEGHPLYQYLGTRTWFWRIVVSGRGGLLEAVACRLPFEPGKTEELFAERAHAQPREQRPEVQFRIVRREYRE